MMEANGGAVELPKKRVKVKALPKVCLKENAQGIL